MNNESPPVPKSPRVTAIDLTEKVTGMFIDHADRLDRIMVILFDIAPGQGRILIECYGEAWAAYWPAMSEGNLAHFVAVCDPEYVRDRLRTHNHKRDAKAQAYLLRIVKAVQAALRSLSH